MYIRIETNLITHVGREDQVASHDVLVHLYRGKEIRVTAK